MAARFSLTKWYDGRPVRERAVLLVGFTVLLFLLVNYLALQPLEKGKKQAEAQNRQIRAELAELTAREQAINVRKNVDPDRELKSRLAALEQESARLDRQLEKSIVNLVAPDEMAEVLKELLSKEEKLELISLENLAPQQVDFGDRGEQEKFIPQLFRHSLRMTFSGDYLTLLEYLRQLDELPQTLIWEEVDIETEKYPQATVRLQVYTMSLTEGWIGG